MNWKLQPMVLLPKIDVATYSEKGLYFFIFCFRIYI